MCKVSSSERPAYPRRVLLCRRELETLQCRLRVLFGGGTVGPPDGGSLTPRFVKEFMSVLVNERSQMHKRLTFLSSIHAPRMANSSLSSYIIKSPPIAEKARSSRDRILRGLLHRSKPAPHAVRCVCTSACPKLALSPAPPISTHRRTYVPQKSRKAHSPKSACSARTPRR